MERLKDDEVLLVLQKDQGKSAQMLTWSTEVLATHVDGATSDMLNIKVKFVLDGKEEESCYVAKMSPTREVKQDDFHNFIFTNECRFYSEIVPAITSILEEVGAKPVVFPKCYHQCREEGKEVLFLENMKAKGYKMMDKSLGLDLAHTDLVLKQLGRLHAAAFMLQTRLTVNLTDKYNFYKTDWTTKFNWGSDWGTYMTRILQERLRTFKWTEESEHVAEWIKEVIPEVWPRYLDLLAKTPPFATIIHGDCWINNMLFRYDANGNPVDVVFLDLQGSRVASVALELQHFLCLNVQDEVRRPGLDALLATYYDSLTGTIQSGNVTAPFTLDELKAEYISKGFYGVLYSIMWLPVMMSSEEINFETNSDEDKALNKHELPSSLLSVFREWTHYGLIVKNKTS